jgi:hypothetical protein
LTESFNNSGANVQDLINDSEENLRKKGNYFLSKGCNKDGVFDVYNRNYFLNFIDE